MEILSCNLRYEVSVITTGLKRSNPNSKSFQSIMPKQWLCNNLIQRSHNIYGTMHLSVKNKFRFYSKISISETLIQDGSRSVKLTGSESPIGLPPFRNWTRKFIASNILSKPLKHNPCNQLDPIKWLTRTFGGSIHEKISRKPWELI